MINTKAIDPEDLSEIKSGFEEYTTNQVQIPGAVTFYTTITNSTNDNNFSVANVSLKMSVPIGMTQPSQPDCAVGTTQQTSNRRTCVLDQDGEPLTLLFGNYNYYTCSPLGNKWVFDASINQCVLPPKNKNEVPQYAAATVRDFQLCSVALSGGSSGISVSSPSTQSAGTALETSTVSITRNGSVPLRLTLGLMTSPTFVATFKTTCN